MSRSSKVSAGLQELLEKKTVSPDTLRTMVLQFVRKEHCGKPELARFRASYLGGSLEVDQEKDVSVEAMVDDLISLKYSSVDKTRNSRKNSTVNGQARDSHSNPAELPTARKNTKRVEEDDQTDLGKDNDSAILTEKDAPRARGSEKQVIRDADVVATTTTGVQKHASGRVPVTQATLQPMEEFKQMQQSFQQMRAAFLECQVAMADQEQRYLRKMQEVARKVDDLTMTLTTVRREAKETEEKLTKKVKDLTSRLGEVSAQLKTQQHLAKPCNPTGLSQSPVENTTFPSPTAENAGHGVQSDNPSNTEEDAAEISVWTTVQPKPRRQPHVKPQSVQNNCETLPTVNIDDQPINSSASSKSANQTGPVKKPSNSRQQLTQAKKSSTFPTSNGLRGARTIRKTVFFLGGISPECSADDITTYCSERGIMVSACRLLESRLFGTKSARLSVSQADALKENILGESFWPENITIRPWHFPNTADPSPNASQTQ